MHAFSTSRISNLADNNTRFSSYDSSDIICAYKYIILASGIICKLIGLLIARIVRKSDLSWNTCARVCVCMRTTGYVSFARVTAVNAAIACAKK